MCKCVCGIGYTYCIVFVYCDCTMYKPYDIPINAAYKTLSKCFIQALSLVTPVHITQTATRLVHITHCIHETNFKISYLSQSAKI